MHPMYTCTDWIVNALEYCSVKKRKSQLSVAGRFTMQDDHTANTNRLVVPPVKLTTVDSGAFVIASPHVWNRLPTDVVVAANSLPTFRRLLKCFFLYSGMRVARTRRQRRRVRGAAGAEGYGV